MNKDWTKYNSFEEWKNAGKKENCYYKVGTQYKFLCPCGAYATLWHEFEFTYGQQNIIVCDKCGYEESIYGVDG